MSIAPTPPNPEQTPAPEVKPAEAKPIDGNPYGESTLKEMAWEHGRAVKYQPLTITFLTGDYSGKVLDMGFNVSELSEAQTASWGEVEAKGIRGALQFDRLSTRTFNLSFEFWSDSDDIRQLVENVAHVQEITGKEKTPPFLSVKIGKAKISPVVCDSFAAKYDTPLPNQMGFRHGTVTLGLKLQGGANSPHGTGKPLSATPLADYARSKSETEKEAIGQQARVQEVLTPCLKDEGSEAIAALLSERKINDPAAVAALPPRSLVNLAVSGLNPHVLSDPAVQTALSNALAFTLARSEQGGNPSQFDAVAKALKSEDSTGVSGMILTPGEDGVSQLDRMRADYKLILEAIQTQSLSSSSPVFDRRTNPTSGTRLSWAASCGMNLRSAGGLAEKPPNPENPTELPDPAQEKTKLDDFNKFLATKPSRDELGLKIKISRQNATQEFRDCMINAMPLDDRKEFDTEVERCSGGKVTGASAWGGFR